MLDPAGPEVGEWHLIPQTVIEVAAHYPPHVTHRWMVASRAYAGELPLVLRTTKAGFGDTPHEAHDTQHATQCGINQPGWLCRPAQRHQANVTSSATFSCHEPDDAVRETVMSWVLPPRRPTRRRGRR